LARRFASRHSGRATDRPSGPSWTVVRPACRWTRPSSSGTWTAAGPAGPPRQPSGRRPTGSRSSGLFEGKTTGTPIALLIRNTDVRSRDYESIKTFRPSHADYTYQQKYGIRDYRGGGRASARETAVRVAAGAVARELLKREGIEVYAYLLQMGNVRAKRVERAAIDGNPFFAPDPDVVPEMEKLLEDVRSSKDSIGALVEVVAEGVPPGSRPVRCSPRTFAGLGSIPAVRAEIMKGSAS
jgi:chorismate synthase